MSNTYLYIHTQSWCECLCGVLISTPSLQKVPFWLRLIVKLTQTEKKKKNRLNCVHCVYLQMIIWCSHVVLFASCVLWLMWDSLLLLNCSMQFALILIQTKTYNITQFGILAHIHTLTGSLIEAEPCLHIVWLIIRAFMISECVWVWGWSALRSLYLSEEVPGWTEDNWGYSIRYYPEHLNILYV